MRVRVRIRVRVRVRVRVREARLGPLGWGSCSMIWMGARR